MKRTPNLAAARPTVGRLLFIGASALTLALLCATHARAESSFKASGGALTASAHLDFRVIIEPSIGLTMGATNARVLGNSGVLVMQHDATGAADGQAASGAVQIQPRHNVIDTKVALAAPAEQRLLTIAAP